MPPTPDEMMLRTLDAADARVARVLDAAPHSDLASRDPRIMGQVAVDRLLDEHPMYEAQADAAKRRAQEATAGLHWWTKLCAVVGFTTRAQGTVDRLHLEADANALVSRVRASARSGLDEARSRGAADAHRAIRERAAWEALPEVIRAVEEQRLNRVVREAVRNGDPALAAALLDGNVHLARRAAQLRARAIVQEHVDLCSMDGSNVVNLSEAAAVVRLRPFP